MNIIRHILIGFSLILIFYPLGFLHAEEPKKLALGIGFSLSPYFVKGEDRGAEFDLVHAVLTDAGYEMEPRYVSMSRRIQEFETRRVDGILTVTRVIHPKACLTDVYISYQNVVLSMSSDDLKINNVSDLARYRIAAFQTAHVIISPEYTKMAEKNRNHYAISTQINQVRMLFRNRVDVAVSDLNIFNWYAHQLSAQEKIDLGRSVRIHPLFPPSGKMATFWDHDICRAFNKSLQKLKNSGALEKLISHYGLFQDIISKESDLSLADH